MSSSLYKFVSVQEDTQVQYDLIFDLVIEVILYSLDYE